MSEKAKSGRKPRKGVIARGREEKLKPSASGVKHKVADLSSLIVFDSKTRIFLVLMLVLYFGMSILKLHTSSIGNWDKIFGGEESPSVLAGKPRYIRMDEWMVTTPALIGEYQLGMPLSNPASGAGNVPVVVGYPVKDMTMLLRPNVWPYFILDVERAFAFSWNFNIFIFIISTFLFLMLLTKNNFWLSVFGSLFLFIASGNQWWSYSIGSYMVYLNGAFIGFIYILYKNNWRSLIIPSIILLFSIYGYIGSNIYPPFQVPLAYLYLFILIGYLLQKKDLKTVRQNYLFKIGALASVLVVFGLFAYHYFTISRESYQMMMNTVYPGKRISLGGDLIKGKVFSEFFGMFMTDVHTPKLWMNICEESGYLMFFPILFYCIAYEYIKTRKWDPLHLAISVYIIISMVYVTVGFPLFLSKVTLFYLSQACRTLPILELGNSILLICFLSNKEILGRAKFSWTELGALGILSIAFVGLVAHRINKVTENFFTTGQVLTVIVLTTVVYLLIRYKYVKYATVALCSLLLLMNISNAGVNPLTSGLSPLLENPLVQTAKAVYEKDPKARWAVFGNQQWANLLKTNGINVFNGVKTIPNLKDMAVLDKSGKYDSAYNRYAHITMSRFIDGNDSVFFRQPFPDVVGIFMDPCSPKLEKLGIKYFLFTYKPLDAEVRCMKAVDTITYYLYKRTEP